MLCLLTGLLQEAEAGMFSLSKAGLDSMISGQELAASAADFLLRPHVKATTAAADLLHGILDDSIEVPVLARKLALAMPDSHSQGSLLNMLQSTAERSSTKSLCAAVTKKLQVIHCLPYSLCIMLTWYRQLCRSG